ncbi:MAG: DUF4252 domain-containing protein [Acidobacteriaceae bacterium]|nr:DUF4252 domain-containing protein [Acidobacteriaceae bacterium]
MKRNVFGFVMAVALAMPSSAFQNVKMPVDLDKLSERASESVDVTLDSSMLQLASGFLSKDDPEEAQVKKLVSKLKGVYVRSFEFDKEGQYSPGDVEAIRSQLKGPAWSRIVGVKSTRGENSEVYLRKDGDQVGALVVIDAEPKELTVVHIDGPINPEELSELGGHMGIPKMRTHRSDKDQSDPHREKKEQ